MRVKEYKHHQKTIYVLEYEVRGKNKNHVKCDVFNRLGGKILQIHGSTSKALYPDGDCSFKYDKVWTKNYKSRKIFYNTGFHTRMEGVYANIINFELLGKYQYDF